MPDARTGVLGKLFAMGTPAELEGCRCAALASLLPALAWTRTCDAILGGGAVCKPNGSCSCHRLGSGAGGDLELSPTTFSLSLSERTSSTLSKAFCSCAKSQGNSVTACSLGSASSWTFGCRARVSLSVSSRDNRICAPLKKSRKIKLARRGSIIAKLPATAFIEAESLFKTFSGCSSISQATHIGR